MATYRHASPSFREPLRLSQCRAESDIYLDLRESREVVKGEGNGTYTQFLLHPPSGGSKARYETSGRGCDASHTALCSR